MADESERMTYRELGATGERVSAIGLGGFHIGQTGSHEEGVRLAREAIDRGITFLDNSWDYNQGESDRVYADALAGGYRNRVFLMTKVDGRTKKTVRQQLDESLMRMKVDYLDLLQLHEVIYEDDPERAYAPGGALEGLEEARDTGKARFLGFTGHKDPAIHLRMLDGGFAFDAVQMPLNLLDAQYDSFQERVLPVLLEREIGVLGMKPLADRTLVETGVVSAAEALRYALTLPADVVITGIQSRRDLDQALEVVSVFEPFDEEEIRELLQRTSVVAEEGKSERYKTTNAHDGTSGNPEWLGLAG